MNQVVCYKCGKAAFAWACVNPNCSNFKKAVSIPINVAGPTAGAASAGGKESQGGDAHMIPDHPPGNLTGREKGPTPAPGQGVSQAAKDAAQRMWSPMNGPKTIEATAEHIQRAINSELQHTRNALEATRSAVKLTVEALERIRKMAAEQKLPDVGYAAQDALAALRATP